MQNAPPKDANICHRKEKKHQKLCIYQDLMYLCSIAYR